MTELRNVIDEILKFGDEHRMINEVLIVADEDEYASLTFKYRSLLLVVDGARIPRDSAEPIYEVDLNLLMIDKTITGDKVAYIDSVQENLFIMGQLQDYIQQSLPQYDFEMANIDLTPIASYEHNITGAESVLTIRIDRDSYKNEINNG